MFLFDIKIECVEIFYAFDLKVTDYIAKARSCHHKRRVRFRNGPVSPPQYSVPAKVNLEFKIPSLNQIS